MLELQSALIARLKDPAFTEIGTRVHPRDEFEGVETAGMQGATLYVKWARMKQVDVAGAKSASAWDFEWWVVLAWRNVRQTQDGLAAGIAEMSPLLRAVAARLQGWNPELPRHNALEMITPPDPEYIKGLYLIPLAFRCRQFITS